MTSAIQRLKAAGAWDHHHAHILQVCIGSFVMAGNSLPNRTMGISSTEGLQQLKAATYHFTKGIGIGQ